MAFIEEDSFGELGIIMAAIREADKQRLVYATAVIFHRNAMHNAQEAAAAAHQRSKTKRHLFRETVKKHAAIFAATAAIDPGTMTAPAVKQEEKPRGDSAVFESPTRSLVPRRQVVQAAQQKQDGFEGYDERITQDPRGECANGRRVREWQLQARQARATSVADEDILSGPTALASTSSSTTTDPMSRRSSEAPTFMHTVQDLSTSRSCGDLSQRPANMIRTMEPNGIPVDLNTRSQHRASMQSAPESPSKQFFNFGVLGLSPRRATMPSAPDVPSIPAKYKYPGSQSRVRSQQAFHTMAEQTKRQDAEEKRVQMETGGHVDTVGESTAFL